MCIVIDLKNPIKGKDGLMHDRLEGLQDYHDVFGDILCLAFWENENALDYDQQLAGGYCACGLKCFALLEHQGLKHKKDFCLDWEDFDDAA